jgi:SnoaL-like polyketide cyclase
LSGQIHQARPDRCQASHDLRVYIKKDFVNELFNAQKTKYYEKDHASTFNRAMKALCLGVAVAALTGCSTFTNSELARYQEAERIGNEHLAVFDTLDYDVYTNQKWDRLSESHAKDIFVHYPDGHTTKGLAAHIEELKPMFVFAPDTRIKVHPVRIQSGDWTSVIGVMEGTFTKPMHTPDGKAVQPTGKGFKLMMCTVGHWKGVMDEEYLFWDNLEFMKQIGLAQ